MAQRRLLSLWLPAGWSLPGGGKGGPDDLPGLALWCQRYSPLTAADPPDGIIIDISGCAHLFGGEAGLKDDILRRLPGAHLAIAGTAAAAWGLARYGEIYGRPGSEDIAMLPLAALQLNERVISRLRRVGVRRIGELRRLPRAELTAGYGPETVLQLGRAFGQVPEAFHFISAPPDWREAEHYAEPIFAPSQLQAALSRLTGKLCGRLADAQKGVTGLIARFYRIDAQRPEIFLGFAAPCRDEWQIGKLLNEKLQSIDPGFGVDAITVEAGSTGTLAPAQYDITRPAPDYARPINTVLNRLGSPKFWRAAPHASHIPEFATKQMPITILPVPWSRPRHPRPIKLLKKPNAITAIAPVPDEPPVLFSWRGKNHRIARATGPERICRDWWRHGHDNARPEIEHIRDYYAVEDTEGARFWLFRTGMHDGVAPVRWYLHGFFG